MGRARARVRSTTTACARPADWTDQLRSALGTAYDAGVGDDVVGPYLLGMAIHALLEAGLTGQTIVDATTMLVGVVTSGPPT